jgi:hypothetical protein
MEASVRESALVLAVDPGSEHVGFSLGFGDEVVRHGIKNPYEFVLWFVDWAPDRIVIERFDIRQYTNDSLGTIKLIGYLEWHSRVHEVPVAYVNASDKKKFIAQVLRSGISSHAADAEAIRLWDLKYGKW